MHVKAREYFDRLLRENQSVHEAIMGVQTVVLQLYALLTNVFTILCCRSLDTIPVPK